MSKMYSLVWHGDFTIFECKKCGSLVKWYNGNIDPLPECDCDKQPSGGSVTVKSEFNGNQYTFKAGETFEGVGGDCIKIISIDPAPDNRRCENCSFLCKDDSCLRLELKKQIITDMKNKKSDKNRELIEKIVDIIECLPLIRGGSFSEAEKKFHELKSMLKGKLDANDP